jgi:hypothetical protein
VEIIFLWFSLSIVAGIIAASKNRHAVGYFLLSLALSPLVGLILAIALPRLSRAGVAVGPTRATHIKCPDCAELILIDAKVCKHCGCRLASGGIPAGKIPCPDCRRLNDASDKHCAVCGHNLH